MASSPIAALSIRERLGSAKIAALAPLRMATIDNHGYRDLKLRIHGLLLERVDLESMQRLSQERIREELRGLVERLLEEEAVVINDAERKSLTRDIQHEMLGFGPLETLLSDASVSDILVNGHKQVYVERGGRLS